jgi:hypothetical protein
MPRYAIRYDEEDFPRKQLMQIFGSLLLFMCPFNYDNRAFFANMPFVCSIDRFVAICSFVDPKAKYREMRRWEGIGLVVIPHSG